jgi:hypothetical protein
MVRFWTGIGVFFLVGIQIQSKSGLDPQHCHQQVSERMNFMSMSISVPGVSGQVYIHAQCPCPCACRCSCACLCPCTSLSLSEPTPVAVHVHVYFFPFIVMFMSMSLCLLPWLSSVSPLSLAVWSRYCQLSRLLWYLLIQNSSNNRKNSANRLAKAHPTGRNKLKRHQFKAPPDFFVYKKFFINAFTIYSSFLQS